MEKLMQYVWEHRLWNPAGMATNDGKKIRVIDPGLRNDDAGPDFFNAKIEIDGYVWAGNVEIHYRASDWKRHGHDKDTAYDSVILHVVDKDDAPVFRSNGERIPQMVMQCSPHFTERYAALVDGKTELPCKKVIAEFSPLESAEWIEAMAFERLQAKSERISQLLTLYNGNWEAACYVTFARTIGFGTNNDAFERLAKSLPLQLLHKHSDSLTQIEALFFGQAGMLDNPQKYADNRYYQQLCREYSFLKNKFSLRQPEGLIWKSFRMRPQNFPSRRIAMLARYVEGGFRLMANLLDANGDIDKLRSLFAVSLTGYWTNHYTFAGEAVAPDASQAISRSSIDVILINTVVPLYYAYGTATDDYSRVESAIAILEQLKPENNRITALFLNAGMKIDNALASQAVIQVRNEYCNPRKCLYCRAGHKLLSAAAHE